MKQYIYPAVFFKEDYKFTVAFPDLNIFTDGDNLLETFLFAKSYLKEYIKYSLKYDMDIETPTALEKIKQRFNEQIIMFVDAIISNENDED